MSELHEIGPPGGPIFRVARRAERPFAPTSWQYALGDGTFGNRFDDPGNTDVNRLEQRFRTIYCATHKAGAFGETLARYRPSVSFVARLRDSAIAEGENADAILEDLGDSRDPTYPDRGLVPISWRLDRHVGVARIDPSLRCVDITNVRTLNHLRSVVAPTATELELTDVDLSAVTSSARPLTQACARYIYEQGFAGIRYLSRLNADWECWALFDTRLRVESEDFPEDIRATDPELLKVAAFFNLTIEGPRGHFIRP